MTISITDITLNGADLGNFTVVDLENCIELGSTFVVSTPTLDLRVAILTQGAGNSANGELIITYTVDGSPDAVTAEADATPPIVGGGACTTFSAAEKVCLASLAA